MPPTVFNPQFTSIFTPLFINLGIVMLAMVALWRVAVTIRDVSFIDAIWAYGMVGAALTSLMQRGAGSAVHAQLLVLLTAIWGLRLGTHLLLRWRRLGRDPRYERIIGGAMERRGWSFATAALLIVFLLQGPLLWIVSLPAQVGILSAEPGGQIGGRAWAGLALCLLGIAFESIGDAQLEAFRKNADSAGQVMDRGLWRYTRHPNYFGDACAWWGIWLVASETGAGLWTIGSPVLLTWMLMRWSGAPMLEKGLKKTRPGYADYVARTSGFVPWPPRQG